MKKADYSKELASFDKADLVSFIMKRCFRLEEVTCELKYLRWDRKSKQALAEMDAALKDHAAATTREGRLAADLKFQKATLMADRADREFGQ